ncbi:MAG: septal ring lytic transglycosylase RlpA family protein [Bacteroidales bacterium]
MNRILLLGIALFSPFILLGQTGYVQEGKASFYADKFEGRTTASGERYSHSRNTCAHLTLPFGTLVKVTNQKNNKSLEVRVNDRGPFVPNRIIDLSRSAAEKLGFIDEGIADVKIEVIDEEGELLESPKKKQQQVSHAPPQKPEQEKQRQQTQKVSQKPEKPQKQKPKAQQPKEQSSSTVKASVPLDSTSDNELYELVVKPQRPDGYAVQIGSYKELVNLLRISSDISSSLNENVRVQVSNVNGDRVYRLLVGNFKSHREADSFKEKASETYNGCFVVNLK